MAPKKKIVVVNIDKIKLKLVERIDMTTLVGYAHGDLPFGVKVLCRYGRRECLAAMRHDSFELHAFGFFPQDIRKDILLSAKVYFEHTSNVKSKK